MRKFLNVGINRKQYILLVLLGIFLAPISAIVAYYLFMMIFNLFGGTESIKDHPLFGLILILFIFSPIGIYFYILKIKRLHDMGYTSDAFGMDLVPYGDIFLHLMLFWKKGGNASTKKRLEKTSKHLQSPIEKVLVFLIFFIGNWFVLYQIGAMSGMQDWQHGYFANLPKLIQYQYDVDKIYLLLGSLFSIFQFLFLPYLYSYFFRLLFNKWRR
jgi:hypothetical protein